MGKFTPEKHTTVVSKRKAKKNKKWYYHDIYKKNGKKNYGITIV